MLDMLIFADHYIKRNTNAHTHTDTNRKCLLALLTFFFGKPKLMVGLFSCDMMSNDDGHNGLYANENARW